MLKNICVLELTGSINYCGRLLRDLGAEVILVEPLNGCSSRREGPFFQDDMSLNTSLKHIYYNAGKKSITLDYTGTEGQELLRAIIRNVDVLITDYSKRELDNLNLNYETFQKLNSQLIMANISGFGIEGKYSNYWNNDFIAFAMGGLMHISGDPALPPVYAPGNQAYDIGSLHAAIGILIALWQRCVDKLGQFIDLSIQDCFAVMEHNISRYSAEGYIIKREGSQHELAVPGGIFECRDGYVHLFVSPTSPESWGNFKKALGDPETDVEWEDAFYRREHAPEVSAFINELTKKYNKLTLSNKCQVMHVPCVPVNSIRGFLESSQIKERNFVQTVEDNNLGTYQRIGHPYRFSNYLIEQQKSVPGLGEHNLEVYSKVAGLEAEELGILFQKKII